jgi:hypothetical protein
LRFLLRFTSVKAHLSATNFCRHQSATPNAIPSLESGVLPIFSAEVTPFDLFKIGQKSNT